MLQIISEYESRWDDSQGNQEQGKVIVIPLNPDDGKKKTEVA